MNDLSAHIRIIMRVALFHFAACLFLWAFIAEIRPFVAGLLLGSVISIINGQLLAYKIQRVTQIVLENSGKRVNLGFLARISMSLIAVMIGLRMPQFDLILVIVGLFFVQVVSFITGFLTRNKL